MYIIFSQTYFYQSSQKGFTLAAFIYESLAALKPIQKLVSEAGDANDDKARTLFKSDVREVLGAAGGIGAGAAAGAGILTASAASGAADAAALTSGLATAGAVFGGGMVAGIWVIATPAVILGVAGVWTVARRNKRKLLRQRRGYCCASFTQRISSNRESEGE
jgi:hypothetical protein